MRNKIYSYSIFPLLILVFIVWAANLNWELNTLTKTELFPLFGLIAWVTMWWHFFLSFIRRIDPEFKKNDTLHKASAYWVFASFVLHPALLLMFAMDLGYSAVNGQAGTPTDFYNAFVGPDYVKFITLGWLSLFVFIGYDIARLLSKKNFVKKHWKFIDGLSDLAFIGIWIHSLALGSDLQSGWFRYFWILLGLSGISFIIYKHYYRLQQKTENGKQETETGVRS